MTRPVDVRVRQKEMCQPYRVECENIATVGPVPHLRGVIPRSKPHSEYFDFAVNLWLLLEHTHTKCGLRKEYKTENIFSNLDKSVFINIEMVKIRRFQPR